MLNLKQIKQAVQTDGLNNDDKLIICFGTSPEKPLSRQTLLETLKNVGLNSIRANLNNYLQRLKKSGSVIKVPDGWELTKQGLGRLSELTNYKASTVTSNVSTALRQELGSVTDPDTKSFIEEAIACYETKQYRASVVLIWVGAVSVLYDYVMKHKLTDFNQEAAKRDPKWRAAKTKDDLARMKEHDFLQVICRLSIVGKNVKDELESCLKLRNGCGHPNSLKLGESRVSAHIETLILNVFSKFT